MTLWISPVGIAHGSLGHVFCDSKTLSKNRPTKHTPFGAYFRQVKQNNGKKRWNEDHFGSLLGSFCELFSVTYCFMFFGYFSTKKNKKNKKWKSGFGYVNYSVSWGSPGWKKIRKLWKFTTKKTSIFDWKSIRFPVKKMSQTKYAIKITQNAPPRALWRSMGWFLLHSGTLRASQNR